MRVPLTPQQLWIVQHSLVDALSHLDKGLPGSAHTKLRHACFGLDIQTQKCLCIGWAYIEPPVAIVNRHAIQVIDRERMLAEMFLNRFHLARDVVDTGVDLATTYPCIQRFDQL